MRHVAALCLLALLAGATAATPAPARGAPTLKSLGVTVRWPAKTAAAGDAIAVKVRSKRRLVTVALLNRGRTVARRALRTGTFRATLARPGTYELRVRVGRHRYARTITVAAPCARTTGTSATLGLSASTARAGDTLTLTITNTSVGCLYAGPGYRIEQLQPDGTWAHVNADQVFPAVAVLVHPGATYSKPMVLDGELAPGRYRVGDEAIGAGRIALSAPFEILP